MRRHAATGHEAGGPGLVSMRTKVELRFITLETAAAPAAPDGAGRGWASLAGKASSPAPQPKSRFPRLIIILQNKPKEQLYRSGVVNHRFMLSFIQ